MPGTRHVSRQTILSSTRPASHHHVHLPATVQGSQCKRVSERHSMPARLAFPAAGWMSATSNCVMPPCTHARARARSGSAHLIELWRAGKHTSTELAELFSVARSTIYRAVQRADEPTSAA
jgi:hypothetical protein